MKVKFISVFWIDSDRGDGWHDLKDSDENMEPSYCFTRGILISENEIYYKITTSVSRDEFLSFVDIPKRAVVRSPEIEEHEISLEDES